MRIFGTHPNILSSSLVGINKDRRRLLLHITTLITRCFRKQQGEDLWSKLHAKLDVSEQCCNLSLLLYMEFDNAIFHWHIGIMNASSEYAFLKHVISLKDSAV